MTTDQIELKLSEIIDVIQNQKTNLPGLMRGEAGLILSLFYYARYNQDVNVNDFAYKRLNELFDLIETTTIDHSFSSGVAGIYWLVLHLQEEKFINISKYLLNEYERFIIKALYFELERGNFDFLHGAIGIAYALLSQRRNNYLIDEVIAYIRKYSIEEREGALKWMDISPLSGRKVFNLGVSHGMLSILIYLSKVYLINNNLNILKLILEGINYYLLNYKRDSLIQFPGVIFFNGQTESNSRLGWCYGDLGIGFSLLLIGKRLNNKNLINEAINILKMTTKRTNFNDTKIIDASLCHGTAGVAHIYHRCFLETNILLFEDSSKYWMMQTLQMAKFEDGFAGYKSFYGSKGWKNEVGFLEGVSGVLLSLSSYYFKDNKSNWGQALLLNL